MKKLKLSVLAFSLLSISALFGQQQQHLNHANMRDGEEVEYCHQQKRFNELMADPAFAAQYQLEQQAFQVLEQQMLDNTDPHRLVYKIPVVFHVLHNGGVENISREQILDALAIMNRDYRLQNADAATVHNDFNASNPGAVCEPSDVEVEFVLASKAPNGACFSGITRTQNALSYDGSDGDDQVDAIVAGNDVYHGQWAGNKYLNIFICGDIGGAAGYTYRPSGWVGSSMKNGIWVLHNYTGSIGTSSENTSRTLTHEAGHWLNLSHTWGDTNDPGVSCGTDNVTDTPTTRGVTACNLNENFCGARANVENYMDYSYCSKMFTAGQVTRMRTALTSSTAGRNNLWTNANLVATGADGSAALCKAEFTTLKTEICAGEALLFSDGSYNAASGWSWSFPGGTPSTSTDQNPSITYSTPGVYSVTLTATDGATSDEETKSGYITVFAAGESLPYFEGFEGISDFNGSNRWIIENTGSNNAWSVTNTAGHTGTNSAKLSNYGQLAGNVDELISTPVDLSTVDVSDGVTLSFRYGYRKRQSANDDYLKVFLTNNCGDDWDQRKTMHSASLSNTTASSAWTPALADWQTVHMTNVTVSYWVENFRFKFRFESDGGNNIYIDDINIYGGAPSETIVVGLDEELQLQNAVVFPNPAEDEVNLRFSAPTGQTVKVFVTDLLGNVVSHHTINANEGDNLVLISTESFAAGMYLIRLAEANASQTLQFVVK
ncbi:MAG: M43 family zinc metalloprotease [Bacteroidota bacterium]